MLKHLLRIKFIRHEFEFSEDEALTRHHRVFRRSRVSALDLFDITLTPNIDVHLSFLLLLLLRSCHRIES